MTMSAYYLAWIGLLVSGLCLSLGGFLWALRKGQFREQERARYLPLRGELDLSRSSHQGGARREACVALGILLAGMSGVAAVVVTMILKNQEWVP